MSGGWNSNVIGSPCRVLNRGVPGSDRVWEVTLGCLLAEEMEAVQGGGGERSCMQVPSPE